MDVKDTENAKQMIENALYAVIATADRAAAPWNSPVFVVHDGQYNFYWASAVKSQHSRNIHENPRAFLVLFDSTRPWGKGEGVYIEAHAEEVTDGAEIAKACELRYKRVAEANQPPSDFTGVLPRRIYRATPERVWVNKDATEKGYFVDTRREISLDELRSS